MLLHHIIILINVTDYALGKSGPPSWANWPKCLLADKCEKSECPLVLSHLCLRSFCRLRADLWHLIRCQKWFSILFRWWCTMWGMCVSLHPLVCCQYCVCTLQRCFWLTKHFATVRVNFMLLTFLLTHINNLSRLAGELLRRPTLNILQWST